jgi:hypothetical protein
MANYCQIFTFSKGQVLVERVIFVKPQNTFESDYDRLECLGIAGDSSMESPRPIWKLPNCVYESHWCCQIITSRPSKGHSQHHLLKFTLVLIGKVTDSSLLEDFVVFLRSWVNPIDYRSAVVKDEGIYELQLSRVNILHKVLNTP